MFGYVRPFKPQLRVYEWELYNGLYCGLCKRITKEYGHVSAAMLSYDMVFLALTAIGLYDRTGKSLVSEKSFCPAHPLKKRLCISDSGSALEYAAAVQVILSFHKLMDDIYDGTILQRAGAAAILPFIAYPYRKAADKYRNVSHAVKAAMKKQRQTECARTRSIDRAAEPTAAMTAAVFRELGGCDPELRDVLNEMGYMLGRYIYLSDALDDLPSDMGSRCYNPLAYKKHPQRAARETVYLTLGRLGEIYSRLDLGGISAITDNIIYMGLRYTFDNIGKRPERVERCRDCAGYCKP